MVKSAEQETSLVNDIMGAELDNVPCVNAWHPIHGLNSAYSVQHIKKIPRRFRTKRYILPRFPRQRGFGNRQMPGFAVDKIH